MNIHIEQRLSSIVKALESISREQQRPCVIFKPEIRRDYKNQGWIAVYGDITGSGKTPNMALNDFDAQFNCEHP